MADETFLLDSSFLIRAFRSSPPPVIATRLLELIETKTTAINEIVRLELLIGCRTDEDAVLVNDKLGGFLMHSIGDATWNVALGLGLRLRHAGAPTAIPDLLIAATAIENDAILVHLDSDFDRIARHSDLRVESFVGGA